MNDGRARVTVASKPLRRLAVIRSSNVDKLIEEGEKTVRLCNYVDVYYNRRITASLDLSYGSATPQEIQKFSLKAGDVLITKDSETPDDIAVAALVEPSAEGVVCGYHLSILRPIQSEVLGPYLFWALGAKAVREAFSVTAQGITRFGLTLSGISSVPVPVPTLETQKAIARYLEREITRTDQLIQKKKLQVALILEKFDAQVRTSVTRGRVGSNHNFIDSAIDYLGDVPAHWCVEPIGRRYSVQLGKMLDFSKQSGQHLAPYLRVVDVQWDAINTVDLPEMDFDPSARTRFKLRSGDLLVNEGGSYVGRSAIWRGDVAECFYQKALHRVRPRDATKDSTEFMLWLMWFATKQGVFVARGNQTTIDHLTAEALRRYRFAFPSITEQQYIASFLRTEREKSLRLSRLIEVSIAKLRERRSALITAAVTGQIDVRDVAVEVKSKPNRSNFRLIVGTEIVHRHRDARRFGRIKNQKLLFLAEAHVGISELGGNYIRFAAGPYDEALIQETERGMEAAEYYRAEPVNGDNRRIRYIPLAKAGQHGANLKTLLGDRTDALRRLIDLLRDLNTEATEAITTLYAVWNDALMDGETPDDAALIRGVLREWHPDKRKFTEDNLSHWLAWMRRTSLVPRGQGPRTAHTMTGDLFA